MTARGIKWNSERIYHLLQSMKGCRPYGIEKHFHMMFILERFRTRTGLTVSGDALLEQIEEFYDLNVLTMRDREKQKPQSKHEDFSLPIDYK